MISLPVNDDWVRGGLVSVAATFLLTAAAEWAVKETEKRKKVSQLGGKKLIKKEEASFVWAVQIYYNPDCCALQSAKTRDQTKEA